MDKKEIFLSAAKYRKIEAESGVDAALTEFAKDAGSKKELFLVRTPEGTVGNGRLAANFPDIMISFLNADDSYSGGGGMIRGLGDTEAGAKKSYLDTLLNPGQQAIASDPEKARLLVGNPFRGPDDMTFVKVGMFFN